MDSELAMCGQGENKAIVQTLYTPFVSSQRFLNYLSKDKINIELE